MGFVLQANETVIKSQGQDDYGKIVALGEGGKLDQSVLPTGVGGGSSVGVKSAAVNESGRLIITLTDNTLIDAGMVKGDKGDKGDQGEVGAQGIQGIQGPKGDPGTNGTAENVKVGVPFPWFNDTFPTGTLECNGQTFDAATYPQLTAIYPSLTLPDLRGVVLRGLDRGKGLDVDGVARTVGSYQDDEIKSHKHNGPIIAEGGAYGSSTGTRNRINIASINSTSVIPSDMVQASGGTETRMKNVACYWLVYAN